MTDCVFADDFKDFVLRLVHKDNMNEIEEWDNLTRIEFGLLSWHIGNLYFCPLW